MSMENLVNQPVVKQVDDDEINLMDLLLVIAKHNRFIIKLTAGAAILSVVYALLQPNIYTGKTVVQMPQQNSSAGMMLGQLGQLGGLAGGAMGIKNPTDPYVGILKSRTLADGLIKRFKLQVLYKVETMESARVALADNTVITAGKDGFITIEYSDKDPKLAAEIANAYVEELLRLNTRLDADNALDRKRFYEKQLGDVREELNRAELEMKSFQEKNRIFRIGGGGDSGGAGGGMVLGATGGIPTAELAFIRIAREVKFQEAMLGMMVQQVAAAKVDAAKNSSSIQVLDQALVPEKKSKPKRALIVLLATILAFFVGIIWAFVKEAGERAGQNPEQTERMNLLRRYFRQGK